MPETNGRTLEQMDHVFKDLGSEEDESRRSAIEAAIFYGERRVPEDLQAAHFS